jgi:hypothetical protein
MWMVLLAFLLILVCVRTGRLRRPSCGALLPFSVRSVPLWLTGRAIAA